MSRPLPTDSLSLTGAGAALVTDAAGSIEPLAVAGLIVDDVRFVSRWRIDAVGAITQLVGRERVGPSSDRLIFTIVLPESIDPIGTFERTRTVTGRGLREELRVTAYVGTIDLIVRLTVECDDLTVYEIGYGWLRPGSLPRTVPGERDTFELAASGNGAAMSIRARGWRLDHGALAVDATAAPGVAWESCVEVAAVGASRPDVTTAAQPSVSVSTSPDRLATLVERGRADLHALTIPIGEREVFGAGAPFFLALFGRDALITGIQALVDTPDRLMDVLAVLARHQGTTFDETTRGQPGQILHEMRLGRMGVFGVAPGTPYFGAIDTAPLFVLALGEAMRWGAKRDDVAALVPAARAALTWCREHGDVDGDGFIESVPHPSGLTNRHWKDSGDSVVRADGSTLVANVAVAEVQGYWYRAARSMAEIDQWLGIGDGSEHLAESDRLAAQFAASFVYEDEGGPFVGLALDDGKRLLTVRASNAGQVLWSGILPPTVAMSVAEQLIAPDLFSGWGLRTLSSAAAGYNPFGYHRGSVWPHDTALALLGAARYGVGETVRVLADGLVALGITQGGELPELVGGIGRDELHVPVPYTASCRPQAWAAGASLLVLRGLLGLEPDVPGGVVRLNPSLPPGETVEVRNLRLGSHMLSLVARGGEVVDIEAPTLDVVTGPEAVLAATGWCPPAAAQVPGSSKS